MEFQEMDSSFSELDVIGEDLVEKAKGFVVQ